MGGGSSEGAQQLGMPADNRYAFLVEWLDPQAQLIRQYLLFYYSIDGTVEMDDIKNRRKFLRRGEYPGITFSDLYLGATVNVYSRELVVVDYGDEFTKTQLEQKKEKTLALIKPDAFLKMGKIIDQINKDGFRIGRMRSLQLTRRDAQEFYAEHKDKPFFGELTEFMSSGPLVRWSWWPTARFRSGGSSSDQPTRSKRGKRRRGACARCLAPTAHVTPATVRTRQRVRTGSLLSTSIKRADFPPRLASTIVRCAWLSRTRSRPGRRGPYWTLSLTRASRCRPWKCSISRGSTLGSFSRCTRACSPSTTTWWRSSAPVLALHLRCGRSMLSRLCARWSGLMTLSWRACCGPRRFGRGM